MTGTSEYVRAYTELNCLIHYLPKKYINKIPKNLVEMIREKSDNQYNIKIDPSKKLNEQKISRKTEVLLAILKYNYWCESDLEKEELREIFSKNEKCYQEELREKYNPDNIFKNNIQFKDLQQENNMSMIEYKESIITKIFNKIKKFFNIKK